MKNVRLRRITHYTEDIPLQSRIAITSPKPIVLGHHATHFAMPQSLVCEAGVGALVSRLGFAPEQFTENLKNKMYHVIEIGESIDLPKSGYLPEKRYYGEFRHDIEFRELRECLRVKPHVIFDNKGRVYSPKTFFGILRASYKLVSLVEPREDLGY
jgi:hypothetical protein